MPGVGTTHHVKIGDNYYLVRPGSYRKQPAPLFGARFASGDPDYNNLSFWQHWAQTCWIGGLDAETWQDDAMYFEGVGVDSSQHERLALSRDLGPTGAGRSTYNWTVGATAYGREFVVFNSKLYCLVKGSSSDSKLYYYDQTLNTGDGGWTLKKTFTENIRGVCAWSGKLWFGDGGSSITYMNPDETFGTKAKPGSETAIPYSMIVFRDRMYVPFGTKLWRMKPDETWEPAAFWESVGTNNFIAMELHQGFMYMASGNGHIIRTDGNSTFDIWSFDGGVEVAGLRSYDGRLFVSTFEAESAGGTSGVLYQFSGSAVTELKRWGKVGDDCRIGKMRVAFRRLFYGASSLLGMRTGFGIAVYDSVEDAHSIFASNADSTTFTKGTNGASHIVDDVIFWNGYLFASVRGHGIFRTPLSVKDGVRTAAKYDTSSSGASIGSLNGGWITSSDFDGGTPGLRKLWNKVVIHADLPSSNCSVYAEYSLDGGQNWVSLGSVTHNGVDYRYAKAFKLNNVVGTRFKYRLTLRSTSTTQTPVVHGVITSYLPLPEPNWQWSMTLVLSEEQELLDGTTDTPDPSALKTDLETLFRAQELVEFTDADGTTWASNGPGVLITDLAQDLRYQGPSSDGDLEMDMRITLLEAVEAY